jgi:hypothetical protein
MLKRKTVSVIAALAVAAGSTLWTVSAQTASTNPAAQTAAPKPDKLVLGQNEVTQLLLLMDTNKNGKISKEEYMKFMEAEFDRLDKDKSGELDVKELKQSKLRVSQSAHAAPHR